MDNNNIICRRAVRIMSLTVLCAYVLSDAITGEPVFGSFHGSFSAACLILFLGPLPFESVGLSVLASAPATIMMLLSKFLIPVPESLLEIIFLSFYLLERMMGKYSAVQSLFRVSAVMDNAHEDSRMVYSVVYFAFIPVTGLCPPVAALLYAGLFVLLYCKSVTGKTMLLGPEREKRILGIEAGNIRPISGDDADSDAKMNRVYSGILDLMKTRKPFLRPEYNLESLAADMATNKLYISKIINIYSGRNFRQFINYHRIRYAVELMRANHRIRISKVSLMSGFHTTVSFNMAFRLNMNQTPSEFLQSIFEPGEKLSPGQSDSAGESGPG